MSINLDAWQMSAYVGAMSDDPGRLSVLLTIHDHEGAAVEGLETDNFELHYALSDSAALVRGTVAEGRSGREPLPGVYHLVLELARGSTQDRVVAAIVRAGTVEKAPRLGTTTPVRAQRASLAVAVRRADELALHDPRQDLL